MSSRRIVYWNNIPAPYMVDRFNALARIDPPFCFEAWFSQRNSRRAWAIDESTWSFPYRYLPRPAVGSRGLAIPTPLLGRRLDLLVSLYAGPSFVTGWRLARARGIRTAFWCEVTFDHLVRRRFAKEALKRAMFSRVDGLITAGQDGERYAVSRGARPSHVYLLPHVVDVEHFGHGSDLDPQERERRRSALGLVGPTALYVGRYVRLKGLDDLLHAFSRVQQSIATETSLLLVGDGPEEVELRSLVRELGLKNVVIHGFVQQDVLPSVYALADCFVFPTLGDTWGLVLEEAMACGLPVISSTAVGEVSSRIRDGETGFLVPPHGRDQIAAAMTSLLTDSELRRRIGTAARESVQRETPEAWARRFVDIVDDILARDGTKREAHEG
jgi:glycosyltransferase involved in cell wall biosynthesis